MSPNVSAGNVLRTSSVWQVLGQGQMVNVHHLAVGPAVATTDDEVLEDVEEWIVNAYSTIVNQWTNVLSADHYSTQNFTTGTVFGARALSSSVDGAAAVEPLPPQIAALIVFPTLLSRVQGRTYVPALIETANDGGIIGGAAMIALSNLGNELFAPFTGANGTQLQKCIASVPGAYTLPTGFRVIPNFRTQRRRTANRGS